MNSTQCGTKPAIKQALGESWESLHPLVRRHYDIKPGTATRVVMRGSMDEVYHSAIAMIFILFGRFFGALVPYRGNNIPVVVRNWTSADNSNDMFWHRTFSFPNRPPFIFASRMEFIAQDEIVEYVRLGMGVRMRMSVQNQALVFTSIGYRWNIGPFTVYLPNWLILGRAIIVERAVSNNEFYVNFVMNHPIFGRTFAYSGTFQIIDETVSDLN